MQISNRVGYLIIAIVVIVLLGYFYIKYSKRAQPPPESAIPGAPQQRGENEMGTIGRGSVEGLLDEEGGIIIYFAK